MAAINNIIFLPKVCQFVNTQTSPKHPQSDTGFANAKYSVNGVITHIKRRARVEAIFLRIPKNKKIPTQNSIADRMIAISNGKYFGNQEITPKAVR